MKSFLVITEQGREKRKTSMQIFEIMSSKVPLHIADHSFFNGSVPGIMEVAVSQLIQAGKLPKDKSTSQGFIDHSKMDYKLTIVEGRGLNYTRIY